MKKCLSRCGYNVTVLSDADPECQQPTKLAVRSELQELLSWVKRAGGRSAWFCFFGHGTQVSEGFFNRLFGGEADGLDEALVPTDHQTAGLIKDNELASMLKRHSLPPDSAMVFFFDCCHSGTVLDLPYALRREVTAACEENEQRASERCGRILCISASQDHQEAVETKDGGLCTSAFLNCVHWRDSPAQLLLKMRRYAHRKRAEQKIVVHSNLKFSPEDEALIAREGSGECLSLCVNPFEWGMRSLEVAEYERKRELAVSQVNRT
eukprot:CAMPEP_0119306656 /NCGR_PEP_ID=MMETSP1333-20130426/7357_1 /TAXON_ID=418940 /ORGANISM="Scyphosphaera apsteinii, Strain RCC1455" /LENGTH=265 /DNA_ID=CAMNT_0007310013 /DNA_START=57 /DNA_END=854 /DNA_ORIENTATION=-